MTTLAKTVKVKSDIRPDLGYVIIDAEEFDPRSQVLWTPIEVPIIELKQEFSAEVPLVEQERKDQAEVPSVEQKQRARKRQTAATVVEETDVEEDDATTSLS